MKKRMLAVGMIGVVVLGMMVLGGSVGCSKGSGEGGSGAVATTGGSTSQSSQFVNARCPIMPGNAIDPAHVPDSLTRDYKGQRVAFCCGMCPPAWDKLSDAEKDKKLEAVKAK